MMLSKSRGSRPPEKGYAGKHRIRLIHSPEKADDEQGVSFAFQRFPLPSGGEGFDRRTGRSAFAALHPPPFVDRLRPARPRTTFPR